VLLVAVIVAVLLGSAVQEVRNLGKDGIIIRLDDVFLMTVSDSGEIKTILKENET
jgi:hypothetical protein